MHKIISQFEAQCAINNKFQTQKDTKAKVQSKLIIGGGKLR